VDIGHFINSIVPIESYNALNIKKHKTQTIKRCSNCNIVKFYSSTKVSNNLYQLQRRENTSSKKTLYSQNVRN